MTDLSREELRAHLSAVEAQVRAALRIVAAESKSVQQAHSALRADLSAALIRLQSETNAGHSRLDGKLDRVVSDVNNLGRQRKLTTAILATMVLIFGVTVGLLAGGSWFFLSQSQTGMGAELRGLMEGTVGNGQQSSVTQPRIGGNASRNTVGSETILLPQPSSGGLSIPGQQNQDIIIQQ